MFPEASGPCDLICRLHVWHSHVIRGRYVSVLMQSVRGITKSLLSNSPRHIPGSTGESKEGKYPINTSAETTSMSCLVFRVAFHYYRCFSPTTARGRKHGRFSSGAGGRGLRGGVGGAGSRRRVRCVEGRVREPVALAACGHEGRRNARHAIPPAEKSTSSENLWEQAAILFFKSQNDRLKSSSKIMFASCV